MEQNKKRHFVKLPYSNMYWLSGDEPHPEIFIDDIDRMMYIYSHDGPEGATYHGINFD